MNGMFSVFSLCRDVICRVAKNIRTRSSKNIIILIKEKIYTISNVFLFCHREWGNRFALINKNQLQLEALSR